jgi:hypothetical protein
MQDVKACWGNLWPKREHPDAKGENRRRMLGALLLRTIKRKPKHLGVMKGWPAAENRSQAVGTNYASRQLFHEEKTLRDCEGMGTQLKIKKGCSCMSNA